MFAACIAARLKAQAAHAAAKHILCHGRSKSQCISRFPQTKRFCPDQPTAISLEHRASVSHSHAHPLCASLWRPTCKIIVHGGSMTLLLLLLYVAPPVLQIRLHTHRHTHAHTHASINIHASAHTHAHTHASINIHASARSLCLPNSGAAASALTVPYMYVLTAYTPHYSPQFGL